MVQLFFIKKNICILKITFFQRKPYDFHFSIEKLFDTLRSNFSAKIECRIYTLPFFSNGLLSRFKSAIAAKRQQGTINHITGDIHFITPFLKRNRTINTYHDFTFLKNSKGLSRFVLWLFWVYLPVRCSKYITVISEVTKQELIKYTKCQESKIHVIPNIIPEHFQFHAKVINSENPTILHIGTTPNKNLTRLIEALKEVPCNLLIVGKLTDENSFLLNGYAIKYTNLYQISDEQLHQAYVDCDILSFCSLNEGFGLPILEAQAIGRPVITSNLSSMPEVAGKAACLVNPHDVNSIKEGIQKIITDTVYREQLITAGIENVKRYNPKTVAGMYEALYEKMMKDLT